MIKILFRLMLIPIFITNLHAEEITFKWDVKKGSGIDGFKIYEYPPGELIFESLDDIQTTTIDLDLSKDRTFLMRTFNKFGESGNSNQVTIGMTNSVRDAKDKIQKLEPALLNCLERNGQLILDIEKVNNNMNRLILEKDNEIKGLKELTNRLMNTNEDLKNQIILDSVKIYHPNKESWKQHWCASRETVCNMEDAFAGFKICRYPYIPECGFSSHHP